MDVAGVFRLYRQFGDADYIGETVSQTQHMVQCALLAEKEGFSEEVILGAFFHDVGHLLGMRDTSLSRMEDLGVKEHEEIGAQYLESLGFPSSVCEIVRGHVSAKRYLVYKYPDYYDSLSDASKGTLVHQGGPMSEEEAVGFESSPNFKAMVRMRHWDDAAKDPDMKVDETALEKYEEICHRVLGTHQRTATEEK